MFAVEAKNLSMSEVDFDKAKPAKKRAVVVRKIEPLPFGNGRPQRKRVSRRRWIIK